VAFAPAPPALPYTPDSNASGAAMEALSAPPPDPTPEVPSAMASAAPTTSSAPPQRLRIRLPVCAAFTTMPASPRASGDTGDTGALATADAPPPRDFSMSPARLALSFAPQRSPSAGKLFSDCAGASVVGRIHPLRRRSPPLCRHHTPPSHRIAIAVAIAIITIIAVATVATNTKAPRSDRRSPRVAIMTCPHKSLCSHPCSNRTALSSRRASLTPHARWHRHHCWGPHAGLRTRKRCPARRRRSLSSRCTGSTPHMHTAPTPSLRLTREPRNSPTLELLSLAISTPKQYAARAHGTDAIVEAHARTSELRQRCPAQQQRALMAQHHRWRMELAAAVG